MDYLQIERDDEDDGETGGGVDVSAYVLIVKGDVPPSTRPREVAAHLSNLILYFIYYKFTLSFEEECSSSFAVEVRSNACLE